MKNNIVIVRGGGDIATGTIQKLFRSGFKVLVLEKEFPQCIRRTVSCGEAMYKGSVTIEDFTVRKVKNELEIKNTWEDGEIPIVADEEGKFIKIFKPLAVIDAILAKKNLGTTKDMAPIVIGLGPGFNASKDVDLVIETNRGHHLGRLIFKGKPQENTGNPGNIKGFTTERILRSPNDGEIKVLKDIGSVVKCGEVVGYVGDEEIKSNLDGMVRGMIREGSKVFKGMKIGDIDPRIDINYTKTISDKARAIGGGVLEGILILKNQGEY